MKQPLLPAIFTLLSIFLISTDAFSQLYRPGFVVQATGDTLRGLIRYREGKPNYELCTFKKDHTSDPIDFTPNDIIAYRVNKEALYEQKQVVNKQGLVLSAFVKVLVQGRLSLYKYNNLLYLQKEAGELKPLLITKEDMGIGAMVEGIRTVSSSTRHMILINSLTYDCPVPEKLLTKVLKKISTSDMVAIVENYNNCIQPDSSVTYKPNKPRLAVQKGVLIGNHATALRFNSGPNGLRGTDFPITHNMIVGAQLNFFSPRLSEKVLLQVEPIYSQEEHSGYLEQQEPIVTRRNDYTINLERLAVSTMARYNFSGTNTFTPYLAIGVSSNYILSAKDFNRVETETLIHNSRHVETTVTEDVLFKESKMFYLSATMAVGTSYNFNERHKLQFQLRYQMKHYDQTHKIDRPHYPAQFYNNNSLYFTVAYLF